MIAGLIAPPHPVIADLETSPDRSELPSCASAAAI
jgi:hypothetical protein